MSVYPLKFLYVFVTHPEDYTFGTFNWEGFGVKSWILDLQTPAFLRSGGCSNCGGVKGVASSRFLFEIVSFCHVTKIVLTKAF